jgi:DNA-binding response OmpR family regulator
VRDGLQAQAALQGQAYDLLLLDIGLPGQDGLQLLHWLRAEHLSVPVLVVSARDAVGDRVAGLNLGADDYLTKPFDLDELVARMHALGRRVNGRAASELQLGRLIMRPARREALLDNNSVSLSTREYDLLLALMERPGNVLSREQLEVRLYGSQDELASNAVEVHVHHLRRKLGSAWIKNVRGVGYKLVEVA